MNKINLIEGNYGFYRHIFNNEKKEFKIYKVKFEDIFFNPLNTRVKDIIETNFPRAFFEKELLYSEKLQNLIFESLKSKANDPINKKLLEKLAIGQTEPFVITEKGLIISGNNRYSLIKSNIENKKFKFYEEILVAVIPGDLTEREIIEWEISTQRETDIKLNYDEMNLILRVKELIEQGTSRSKIINIVALKSEQELSRYARLSEHYQELLLYAGIPKKIDFHRDVPVYSFLDGMDSQLIKTTTKIPEKSIAKEIYYNIILGSNMPVQKSRDLIGKVIGNPSLEFEERLQLLKFINKQIKEKVGDSIEKGRNIEFNIKNEDFRKEFKGEFLEFFENISEKIKNDIDFKKNSSKNSFPVIIKHLKKNRDVFNDILNIKDTIIFYSYNENQIDEIKKELNNQIDLIKELISYL